MRAELDACLREWSAALPAGRLIPDSDAARYHENCLSLERRILAVLQPQSEAEIVTIVRIARQYRIALYTISTGHNWGYGTSLPAADDCAILDLSRMTRILDFDAELGLITLEPGVTQKQLAEYLAAQRADFYVPTTGIGPSGSIVGNALERGFGMTPEEDHFRAVTSLRAVLADGTIYRSCFAEAGAPYAGVWQWGIGPYLDGLFAQGNIGIVTALQIALAPKAQHTEVYMFTLKREEELEAMLQACRGLLSDMRGTIGNIKILNRQQLESAFGGNQGGIGLIGDFAWLGFGVVRCRKTMLPSIRKEIRHLLGKHISQLIFINDRRLSLLKAVFPWVPGKTGQALKRQLGSLIYVMDVINGIPRSDALSLVYQHVKMTVIPPVDPVRDGVGAIWYAPVLPMKPALLLGMIRMFQEVLGKYDFPPMLSFTSINEKCAIGVIPIIYKRPEAAERAHQCYQELFERGNAMGCPPYRTNIKAMAKLAGRPDSVYWSSVAKIKAALDPAHILSPGRYAPIFADKKIE